MSNKLHIWLRPVQDFDPAGAETDPLSFLEPQLCYDVAVADEACTLGDYLAELDAFQAATLAECRDCDGCCQERAPLTIYDLALSQTPEEEMAAWLAAWAEPAFFGEALDIRLQRLTQGSAAGCCQFLDLEERCCRIHQRRSFTCRTHCCLPKSPRAEALRGALINAGEDELVRRLLSLPSEARPWPEQLAKCQAEDYPQTALSSTPIESWPQLRLSSLLEPELWQQLCQE